MCDTNIVGGDTEDFIDKLKPEATKKYSLAHNLLRGDYDKWKGDVFGDGGGPYASSLRAQIARDQWEDYKKRFMPLEDKLLGYAKNPTKFADVNRKQALGLVNSAYERAQPQIERRLTSYGLQITPEMQERIAKRIGYNKTLSQVQAANVSDRLSREQITGISGGGLATRGTVDPNKSGGLG